MTTYTINNTAGKASFLSQEEITNRIGGLKELKKDAAILQKRGLPFMMASVVIWTAITFLTIYKTDVMKMNFCIFCCSGLLMPLASLFGRILGADIYRKSTNPINKLGFLCNINQFLYLPIAMWAYSAHPESMLLIYAIIFTAHLLPFSWVYDSKIYFTASFVESLGVILVGYGFGYPIAIGFIVICQIIVCIRLYMQVKEDEKEVESND
ncbi:MAG: hypothetical protein J6I66_08515 [Lachnospiraceae bacterium]|nr:hypothetical protein [Lachnospiraceae bacterium]